MPSWNVVTVSPLGSFYRMNGLTEPKARAEFAAKKPRAHETIYLTYTDPKGDGEAKVIDHKSTPSRPS